MAAVCRSGVSIPGPTIASKKDTIPSALHISTRKEGLKLRLAQICLLMLALISCTSSLNDKIIGEWQCTSRPWTIEFIKGGQIIMKTDGRPKTGKYQLDSLGNLRVEMSPGNRFEAKVSIRGSELILTDPGGPSSKFKRTQ